MNLMEMLTYTDIQQLHLLAQTYRCECNVHSKHELIQSVLSAMRCQVGMQQAIKQLESEQHRFILHLVFEGREVFSLEELLALAQSAISRTSSPPSISPREMISTCKRRGWLFHGHTYRDSSLFYLPKDIKSCLQDQLLNHLHQGVKAISHSQAPTEPAQLILQDISSFLEYVHNHHKLTLKVNDSLTKKDLTQILNRLQVSEGCIVKQGSRFGYGRMFHEYPNRFSFIYDYCFHHHFIEEHQQTLQLTERGKQRLLMDMNDYPMSIYTHWLKLYRTPIPNLRAIVHMISLLAKTWVTVSSLKHALRPLIKPYYYDSVDTILEERILQMLAYFGFISIEVAFDHEHIMKFSSWGYACLCEMPIAK